LLSSVDQIEENKVHYADQDDVMASPAPKIFRSDCEVHWTQDIHKIYNLIRAMIPYPCAWFNYLNHNFKIHKASMNFDVPMDSAGIMIIKDSKLLVSCINGYINILEIQPEGKQSMSAQSFINGYASRLLNRNSSNK
jgi:methionyl-tRNA formyltransferase